MSPAPTPADIADQLRRLGLRRGQLVMIHASLRALGPIEGRATGLLEAVRLAIGPTGTTLMMVSAADTQPFDRSTTPADPENGVLAEVFRAHPGVVVNDHPACRFAAWGPLAGELLEPQPLHDYYGSGSPLERFVQHEGAVLRLGADVDTVTLTHHAENLADIPNKRRKTRRYVRADVGEIAVDGIDDSDGIVVWAHGEYFSQILVDYLATGRAAIGPVGDCTAELLDGAGFVEFAVEWLEREFGGPSE
jgi:aminoglycoside N3'-acetyltransferase